MLNLLAKSFPAVFVLFASFMPAQNATELWSRGYAVIPTPRSVNLSGGDVQIDDRWVVVPAGIDSQQISVRTLRRDLAEWYRLNLNAAPQRDAVIRLSIQPGTTKTGADAEIDKQAYRLQIGDRSVEITGNGAPGLFYGVQTLLQLVKRGPSGVLVIPKGTIEDWPKLQLRILRNISL